MLVTLMIIYPGRQLTAADGTITLNGGTCWRLYDPRADMGGCLRIQVGKTPVAFREEDIQQHTVRAYLEGRFRPAMRLFGASPGQRVQSGCGRLSIGSGKLHPVQRQDNRGECLVEVNGVWWGFDRSELDAKGALGITDHAGLILDSDIVLPAY